MYHLLHSASSSPFLFFSNIHVAVIHILLLLLMCACSRVLYFFLSKRLRKNNYFRQRMAICNYRGMTNSKRKSELISHSDLRYGYFLRRYSICRAFVEEEENSRRMSSTKVIRKNTSMKYFLPIF